MSALAPRRGDIARPGGDRPGASRPAGTRPGNVRPPRPAPAGGYGPPPAITAS